MPKDASSIFGLKGALERALETKVCAQNEAGAQAGAWELSSQTRCAVPYDSVDDSWLESK